MAERDKSYRTRLRNLDPIPAIFGGIGVMLVLIEANLLIKGRYELACMARSFRGDTQTLSLEDYQQDPDSHLGKSILITAPGRLANKELDIKYRAVETSAGFSVPMPYYLVTRKYRLGEGDQQIIFETKKDFPIVREDQVKEDMVEEVGDNLEVRGCVVSGDIRYDHNETRIAPRSIKVQP